MLADHNNDDFKREHQNHDSHIIYFLVIKSIIFFKKQQNSMRPVDILCETYAEWLRQRQTRGEKNILESFRVVAENFYDSHAKMGNKAIYLPTHAAFLIHTLSSQPNHARAIFPLGIILLNFILKEKPKVRITLTRDLILSLQAYFRRTDQKGYSGQLASSALWLVCKCLQGTCNKRTALARLGESGLIEDFLQEGQPDSQAEKAIAMLLYFISKHLENRTAVVSILLKNQQKFRQPEAIRYLLSTLKEASTAALQRNPELQDALDGLMVRYMDLQEVPFFEKMQSIDLIAFCATRNRNLMPFLRVSEIIENKLSCHVLTHEPMLADLMRLVVLQADSQASTARILNLATTTLINNVASRRTFILLHEHLTEPQLIAIMGTLPTALHRLLGCGEERENGLKLMICLKRAVNRLGLGRIFWVSCRGLVQKVLSYREVPLPESSLELYELLEEIMQDEIQFLHNI